MARSGGAIQRRPGLGHQRTKPAMTMQASSVECWVNPHLAKEPQAKWEPKFFWPRQDREILLSDLEEMEQKDLESLRSDLKAEIEELKRSISVDRQSLSVIGDAQPMEARRLNRSVRAMLVKRKALMILESEAGRIFKELRNRHINTLKEHKFQEHRRALRALEYFKRKVLMRLIIESIGVDAFEALKAKSLGPAISLFSGWAKSHISSEMADHLVQSQLNSTKA